LNQPFIRRKPGWAIDKGYHNNIWHAPLNSPEWLESSFTNYLQHHRAGMLNNTKTALCFSKKEKDKKLEDLHG